MSYQEFRESLAGYKSRKMVNKSSLQRYLDITFATMQRYCKQGNIKEEKVGRTAYIKATDLIKYLLDHDLVHLAGLTKTYAEDSSNK